MRYAWQCGRKSDIDVAGLMGKDERFFLQLINKISVAKSRDGH